MSPDTLKRSVKDLTQEQRMFALALAIIQERIGELSGEDREDLFSLFTEYSRAESAEDREAADAGIMEILEQEDVSVKVRTLTADGNNSASPKLEKWLTWVSGRIHALREKAKLSQVELAERTGLPQSHISRLENGKHSPSRYTLEKIAKALGVNVTEFDPTID